LEDFNEVVLVYSKKSVVSTYSTTAAYKKQGALFITLNKITINLLVAPLNIILRKLSQLSL
jgi:hypothetical protein